MSENSKSFKRRVRERMAETGEKYTAAMRAIQAEFDQANSPDEVQENLIPVWLGLPDPGGDASTFDLSKDMLRVVLQAGISLEVVSVPETLHQVPEWMREISIEMGMEDAVMVYDRRPDKIWGALDNEATFNVVARYQGQDTAVYSGKDWSLLALNAVSAVVYGEFPQPGEPNVLLS